MFKKFLWLFRRKTVGGIVSSIVTMRQELSDLVEANTKKMEQCESKIDKAEEEEREAIKKAKAKKTAEQNKQVDKISELDDANIEAQAWLDELPKRKI